MLVYIILALIFVNVCLWHEMRKTARLLRSVFPKGIMAKLSAGQTIPPKHHANVTIFFSDIVGFTDIASALSPVKVVELLDRLYNVFDLLAEKLELFKVETIGDAYMVCANLEGLQDVDHVARIAAFALKSVIAAKLVLIDQDNPSMGGVNIRAGFHSGAVVSGVVGVSTPRFCLFGDTVNVSARMEQNSETGRITVSPVAAALLKGQSDNYCLSPRGQVEIKGKGGMDLFWLDGFADDVSRYTPARTSSQKWRKSLPNIKHKPWWTDIQDRCCLTP